MAEHPRADILRAVADGKTIQMLDRAGKWHDTNGGHDVLMLITSASDVQLRIKPKTIRIGSYDVPEPLRAAPAKGTRYFNPAPELQGLHALTLWTDHVADHRNMARGFVHLDADAAILHAKAIISLTQGDTNDEPC